MSEATTETTESKTEQTDENGIAILTGVMDSWNFVNTSVGHEFFAKFRRLVNIEGNRYAEVDYRTSGGNQPPVGIRYVRLTEFAALTKCQPGDDLNCRWLHGVPFVFAHRTSDRGRPLTIDEWDKLSFRQGDKSLVMFPEMYHRLVEV
ncbi:MAG: hypothetical protein WCE46_02545 [Methanoregula sp.]|uniref:hypothetical protein n=1 Tax=Methanoregula sp. TaxID=2052170 RepID=UPI003C759458